jgi:hypothetical protein
MVLLFVWCTALAVLLVALLFCIGEVELVLFACVDVEGWCILLRECMRVLLAIEDGCTGDDASFGVEQGDIWW